MKKANNPLGIGFVLVLILIVARTIAYELNEVITMSRSDCDRVAFFFILISTSLYVIKKNSLNAVSIINIIVAIMVMLVCVDIRSGVAFLVGLATLLFLPFIVNALLPKDTEQ